MGHHLKPQYEAVISRRYGRTRGKGENLQDLLVFSTRKGLCQIQRKIINRKDFLIETVETEKRNGFSVNLEHCKHILREEGTGTLKID